MINTFKILRNFKMATQDNKATFLAFLRQVKSKYSCDFWITREFDKILKEQKETDFFQNSFYKN